MSDSEKRTSSRRTLRLELSDEDLQEAVVQWAERKGLLSKAPEPVRLSVDIEVVAETTGYGMAESTEHVGRVVLRQST